MANMEVVLHEVQLSQLHTKIDGYEMLYGVKPDVFVKGTFLDRDGEVCFFGNHFHRAIVKSQARRWLEVEVMTWDYEKLAPVDGVLEAVKFMVADRKEVKS